MLDYLYDYGRWREIEPVDKSAYSYRKKILSEKHPYIISIMAKLAITYNFQGRHNEAEKILLEVAIL